MSVVHISIVFLSLYGFEKIFFVLKCVDIVDEFHSGQMLDFSTILAPDR